MTTAQSADALEGLSPAVDAANPWPGLAPFTEDAHVFFNGRDREIDELARLLGRDTLTVLYGQSGLGKTSLLLAGLFPRLRREQVILPVYVRLDYSSGAPALAAQVKEAITTALATHGFEGDPPAPSESLWEYFHRRGAEVWNDRHRLATIVLVFDQFEEIFTLGVARDRRDGTRRCQEFLRELAELVENRPPAALLERLDREAALEERYVLDRQDYKIVLALREDFLAEFDGLKDEIRANMRNRMRLTPMTGVQARSAVLETVREAAGRGGTPIMTPETATAVVLVVAGERGGPGHAPTEELLADVEIDPSLLSLMCRELNTARLRRGDPQITLGMVTGSKEEILQRFYESSFRDIDPRLRAFVEDRLLTATGYRSSYALDDALRLPGVTEEGITKLIARRLLRKEERSGVQRLELTHDVLVPVVRASRDQRQQQEERERLEAARAAEEEKNRRIAAELEREQRRSRRDRVLLAVSLGLLVLAVVSGAVARRSARSANTARREAESERAAAVTSARSESNARAAADRALVVADSAKQEAEREARLAQQRELVAQWHAENAEGSRQFAAQAQDNLSRLSDSLNAQLDAMARRERLNEQIRRAFFREADLLSAGAGQRPDAILGLFDPSGGEVSAAYEDSVLGVLVDRVRRDESARSAAARCDSIARRTVDGKVRFLACTATGRRAEREDSARVVADGGAPLQRWLAIRNPDSLVAALPAIDAYLDDTTHRTPGALRHYAFTLGRAVQSTPDAARATRLALRAELARVTELRWRDGRDRVPASEVASAFGNVSWERLFNRQYDGAAADARHALALDPTQTWLCTNLAHGLLLSGQDAAARAIYLGLKGTLVREGGSFRPWEDVISQDFSELRAYFVRTGTSYPDAAMTAIQQALRAGSASVSPAAARGPAVSACSPAPISARTPSP